MAINRKLITDADFEEAEAKEWRVRVFQDDHLVDAGGLIVRFSPDLVVIQSGVGDVAYYQRQDCEFYEMRKR
ncbi:hypothetical protein [Gorillibacterium sp. CAU 1737]|uniref:hypothetical protein n=1 Tax=Gorillibacterium sp. CAU 1737 TaxID=3140362 RepID=UPI003261B813